MKTDEQEARKSGVLLIGAKGAISTTLISAQCAMRKNLGFTFRAPSEEDPTYRHLPLLGLDDLVFGGWDIVSHSYSESCRHHKIIPVHVLSEIQDLLDQTAVYPAIMVQPDAAMEEVLADAGSPKRMKNVDFATTIFTRRPLADLVKSVIFDIEDFRERHGLKTLVVVNLASTEKGVALGAEHSTLALFERAIADNSPNVTDGMIYAYAAVKAGCHFINFTPSVAAEIPAIVELARNRKVALAGKDGKTGQTLYKTALAPLFKARGLKITGWYSTNILGNRDGLVLNDPAHREQKIKSKLGVLASILGYSDFDHQVHIHYYPPRGDAKEAWDNIDFMGWFDTPMQMKINWLGDDSILAIPLVFDLVRWVEFFGEKGECGILPYLASYFKSPLGTSEHDFFKQVEMLRSHVRQNYPGAE